MEEKMEKLLEILEEIQPDADYENCETLIDDGILDSFAILSIVSELQDEFEITITPSQVIPSNFNSAKALWLNPDSGKPGTYCSKCQKACDLYPSAAIINIAKNKQPDPLVFSGNPIISCRRRHHKQKKFH